MTSTLTLSTHVEIRGDLLVVTYRVENRDRRDAYLLNRSLDSLDCRLVCNRKLLWLSRTGPVPQVLYATAVRAGGSFTEQMRLPLPVGPLRRENRSLQTPGPARLRTCPYVVFSVGYFWPGRGMKEKVRVIEEKSVILPVFPGGTRPEIAELSTLPIRIDVPVLDPQ
jgi:hypothetical protein